MQVACALDDHGRVTVGRLDARAHAAERLGDPAHRPQGQRLVARELEASLLPGDDPGQQAEQCAGVAGGDRPRLQAAQSDTVDDELVVGDVVDLDAERAHGVDRRLGVGRAAEAEHARLPLADRAEQDAAVRDRLVARHDRVADQRRRRVDFHDSSSGETSTA